MDYVYDLYNRLVRRIFDGDGDGQQEEPTSTFFIHDGGDNVRFASGETIEVGGTQSAPQIVLQFDGASAASLAHRYLWGPSVDQILADETVDDGGPEDILWPLTDHQGTVRDIANSSGTIVNHRVYDSFGNLTNETAPAVDHLFGYTARPWDEDTELQWNLNRWYDPSIGRWLSEDPIAADVNPYRYVGNNPLAFMDPTGLLHLSGKTAPSTANTVVCDGKGGLKIQIGFPNKEKDPWKRCGIIECMVEHEKRHISDFEKAHPGLCKCGDENEGLLYDDDAERKIYEVPACNVELTCLGGKKKALAKDAECQKIIHNRIEQIRRYLHGYK